MKNFPIILIIAILVAGGAGFFGGMKYQQSKQPTFSSQFPGGNGQRGFGRNGANGTNGTNRPVYGQIISGDDKSITVKLQDGSSKIVLVTQTTILNKADKAVMSDFTTGQNVLVNGQANSDGSVTAQSIQLNPVMRQGAAPTPTK